MSPTHTRKIRQALSLLHQPDRDETRRRPTARFGKCRLAEIERIVLEQVRNLIANARSHCSDLARRSEAGPRDNRKRCSHLRSPEFEELWNELFPAEQARIVELLVERVDLHADALDMTLKIEGLTSLYSELRTPTELQQAAE